MLKHLLSPPVLLPVTLLAIVGVWAWPYTVDDAYVVARYGRRIAEGRGYTMNDGQVTDGVTGPLWVLPAVGARLVGLDPIVTGKACGLFFMGLGVALMLARLGARAQGRRAAWLALVLIGVQSTPGIWGVAGLETGAATLAFSTALLSATSRPRPRGGPCGFAVACLAWLRPEMALCSAVILAAVVLRDRRRGLLALSIASAGALTVTGFRVAMFHSILPLAFYAKPGPFINGIQYSFTALFVVTGGAGLWLVWRGARHGASADRVIALVVAAHVISVVVAGGDWMPGFRLFAPILPAYAAVAAVGAVRSCLIRRGRFFVAVAVTVACLPAAVNSWVQLPEVRAAGITRERVGKELAHFLKKNARVVALVDVGYLAYESRVEVVDLGGITDPVVAGYPGGHIAKRIDMRYLRMREPDALLLHDVRPPRVNDDGCLLDLTGYPVERWIASQQWVRDSFRVVRVVAYAPNYYYVVLSRSWPDEAMASGRKKGKEG